LPSVTCPIIGTGQIHYKPSHFQKGKKKGKNPGHSPEAKDKEQLHCDTKQVNDL
jgi:hypothetical protein